MLRLLSSATFGAIAAWIHGIRFTGVVADRIRWRIRTQILVQRIVALPVVERFHHRRQRAGNHHRVELGKAPLALGGRWHARGRAS
jgi:hypothetical protein